MHIDDLKAFCPQLRRYAYRLTRNRADSEDLLQDTLERAWRFRGGFSGGDPLSWIKVIMFRRFCDTRRAKREVLSSNEEFVFERPYPPSGEDYCALFDLARVIGELPQGQRETLLLHRLDGMEYREIARTLHVELGTVRSRINRATVVLEEALA